MAFPAARRARRLNDTAKRISDELGKGQEVLRHFGPVQITAGAGVVARALLGIPDVDITIVDVYAVGAGVVNDTVDVLAPATWAAAPAAGNRLITPLTATEMADDTVVPAVVLPLAGRVKAGQPIVVVNTGGAATGAGLISVQASYVLADPEQVTYSNY